MRSLVHLKPCPPFGDPGYRAVTLQTTIRPTTTHKRTRVTVVERCTGCGGTVTYTNTVHWTEELNEQFRSYAHVDWVTYCHRNKLWDDAVAATESGRSES